MICHFAHSLMNLFLPVATMTCFLFSSRRKRESRKLPCDLLIVFTKPWRMVLLGVRGVWDTSRRGDVSKTAETSLTYRCTDSTVTGSDKQTVPAPRFGSIFFIYESLRCERIISEASEWSDVWWLQTPPSSLFVSFEFVLETHWARAVSAHPNEICAPNWIPLSNRNKYNKLQPLFMPHCY